MTETDLIIISLRHKIEEQDELIAKLREENDRLFIKTLDLEELLRDEKAKAAEKN